MKKILIILYLIINFSLFAQTPVLFDRFSLDDEKEETIRVIESEYAYTINEYGGYIIEVDGKTSVEIYFEGEQIRFITVIKIESEYKDFIELVQEIIDRHGEPIGTYVYEESYRVYWWPQNPSFDLSVIITLEGPYTIKEMVFYGA